MAIALVGISALAAVPLQAASIGDGWRDGFDVDTFGAVLFETTIGRALLMQIVTAGFLAATLALPVRRRSAATALAAALGLISLTFGGHAVMDLGWLAIAHRVNDALHLLSAGAWFGALLPFVAVMRRLNDPGQRADAMMALRRFSSVGHGAVALVVLTGIANTALIVGGWPFDPASSYQRLLLAKIAIVGSMIVLALTNRYAVVPRLRLDPHFAQRTIRRIAVAEAGLALCAIMLVAWFGLLDPAPMAGSG